MLKLREWEEVKDYASVCANELTFKEGLDVRVKVYTMYDGNRGIALQVFDKYGVFFKEYMSGIHNTVDGYKKAIKTDYFRIKEDI